ncbi:protein of unknown function DUF399 [Desulfovibrio sp. X2]|uniref:ChaN family lipoprotein n=1 Tax=Desulfovibrio sp. X2 TaxID=941449 RepID=UPI0003588FBF|nr:ChaN family lipoprotein [Desulfovibrio sp. X2]EPR37445.1 protein of unknown function DUF399 [Desulfovibrio sp. X2]
MRAALLLAALLGAAFLAACGGHGADTATDTVLDLSSGRELPLNEAALGLRDADVVFLGERHDSRADHAGQLAVIKALAATGRPLAVGLEMIPHTDQTALDAWVAGSLGEDAMRRTFARDWGEPWELYRPIFVFCRDNKIPMRGLNVPSEIARQVAEKGFSSLTPAQAAGLPPVACVIDPGYKDFLKRMYEAHGHEGHGGGSFEHFCEAQVVWDTAMAYYGVRYLTGVPDDARAPGRTAAEAPRPDRTLVVLCGMLHAWKPAMPARVHGLQPGLVLAVFLPREQGAPRPSTDDADYLLPE